MQALSKQMKNIGFRLEQVQDFTPTPMTLSSTIYYSGIDPYSGKKIFCERDIQKKKRQNMQFFNYKSNKY